MAQCEIQKLLRILHYGSEEAVYIPGSRLQKVYYEGEKLKVLRSFIAEFEPTVLFDTIRTVLKNKTSFYPELLLYVLAECARSDVKRAEALGIAEEMCTTAEYFLLFFKFAKGLSPHIGTGRACRRFITNWYLKKNSLELAELVGQTPSYRGWRHADLIKIAHIKSTDPATGAVLTYLSKGVKIMEQKYGDEPKAKEVVSYLKNVDNFRKDEDQTNVIRTIENYMLTVHHINFVHLRSKQVWVALLRRMPVDTLLEYIHLLCKYRMFRRGRQWDPDFLTAVCDVLSNVTSIIESKLQPSKVYIALCTYQFAPKYKLDLAAKNHKRLAQKPPAISYELVENLESLIIATYKNVQPTGLRYVIIVDNHDLNKRRCGHVPYMLASQAAAAIATTFYVSEQNCDILCLSGLSPIQQIQPKSKEPKMQDLLDEFTKTKCRGPQNYLAGLNWAHTQKKEVDVFILIGTSVKYHCIASRLPDFRSKLLVPNFKLVLCSISGNKKDAVVDEENIFTVQGFDEKVCNVIQSFATGVF